jgi:hypothetical protein
MQITTEDYKKVIIRKPTDEEQRNAKIITSDYAISCVTIHSSILYTLGLVDKVYRSKQTVIKLSNKKEIKQLISKLDKFSKYFPKSYSLFDCKNFINNCKSNEGFINFIKDTSPKSWKSIKNIPNFFLSFSTPSNFLKAEQHCRCFNDFINNELMEGMSEFVIEGTMSFNDFKNETIKYLTSIESDAVKKHTQTHIWETAFKNQMKIEEEIGSNFSPRQLAVILNPSSLDSIKTLWQIDLSSFKGTWSDLCNHLYSPTVLADIRNSLGVEVRSRSSKEIRRGVEAVDKKRYENAIKRYEERLGCRASDFSIENEEQKIERMKDELSILEVKYSEGLIAKSHSLNKDNEQTKEITKACQTMRNRINYLRKNIAKSVENLPKKIEAWKTIIEYEKKHDDLMKFINETRPWEEVALIEKKSLQEAINRQRNETPIPYYTWKFVCKNLNDNNAELIENALEENLNKGCGTNGEDEYINVTSFIVGDMREFFIDYPKSSNLYKAFKNKGKELSDILVNGVAAHLGINFTVLQGETYFNKNMEKTMSGDMFEWIGV